MIPTYLDEHGIGWLFWEDRKKEGMSKLDLDLSMLNVDIVAWKMAEEMQI